MSTFGCLLLADEVKQLLLPLPLVPSVMAALVPAIHVLSASYPRLNCRASVKKDADRGNKSGHAAREQGCSTLFEEFHLGEGFDPSESGGVSILGDGVGLIEAEDIVGEAA